MTEPRTDLLELAGVVDCTFWPMWRQELGREAGGRTQAKDLGPPLWRATYRTAPQALRDTGALEAAMISLRGSQKSFLAHDVRRPFPKAHADGVFADTGQITALDAGNAFRLTVGNLEQGFTLSPGDYLGFRYGAGNLGSVLGSGSYALHIVVEGGEVSAAGEVELRVEPYLRPGVQIGNEVTFKRAPCEMIFEPGVDAPGMQDLTTAAAAFSAFQII